MSRNPIQPKTLTLAEQAMFSAPGKKLPDSYFRAVRRGTSRTPLPELPEGYLTSDQACALLGLQNPSARVLLNRKGVDYVWCRTGNPHHGPQKAWKRDQVEDLMSARPTAADDIPEGYIPIREAIAITGTDKKALRADFARFGIRSLLLLRPVAKIGLRKCSYVCKADLLAALPQLQAYHAQKAADYARFHPHSPTHNPAADALFSLPYTRRRKHRRKR